MSPRRWNSDQWVVSLAWFVLVLAAGVAVVLLYAWLIRSALDVVVESRRPPPGACPPGQVYVYADVLGPPVCVVSSRPRGEPRR